MKYACLVFGLIMVVVMTGCVSQPFVMNTELTDNYEVLGEASGTSLGMMLLFCVPVGSNERYFRAYNDALKSLGGDVIINPQVRDQWYFTPVGNVFKCTVSGTVVKNKEEQ